MPKTKKQGTTVAIELAILKAKKLATRFVTAYGKAMGMLVPILVEMYPTKKLYLAMPYEAHMAFLRGLRTDDNKATNAYQLARKWLDEERGGMRDSKGGYKATERDTGPIPAGVWLRTIGVKAEAFTSYFDKLPTADIEPALRERIIEVSEEVLALMEEIEIYRETERQAADDKAAAEAVAKTAKAK